MAKYFKQSWTGNFYRATYNALLARGEDDNFFSGLAVADFTGDGIVDVLQFVGNNAYGQDRGNTPSHGQFLLLQGHRNGTFTDATSLLPGSGTNVGPEPGRLDGVMRHLMVGDVNGDGRPDFVGSLSYEDGRVYPDGLYLAVQQVAYVSDGPGHWNVVELDNLTWGHGLEVDDFDGDGRDDVITGGFTITPGHQGGTVLSRFPAGEPQANTPIEIGGSTYRLADVDGDGDNEMVNDWGEMDDNGHYVDSGLEVHQIAGGMGAGVRTSTYSGVHHFEVGWEWNGNAADIAVFRDENGDYLRGGMDNITAADLDGDGKEEIIGLQGRSEIGRGADGKINVNLSYDARTEVVFYGWNGTQLVERTDMTVKGLTPALYGIYHYEFVDFNFDGHLDLFIPRWDSGGKSPMQVFINDGLGHFKVVADKLLPPALPGGQAWDGQLLDINDDGIMDVLIRTDGYSKAQASWGPWGPASEGLYLGTTKFYTGPAYTDPALRGAAGFNEQYYLNTHADAAKAVKKHKFDSGLDHFLEVGAKKGYFGFAINTHIFGSDKNDTLKAREGHERLDGGLGKDALTGKAGGDAFVFSTKLGPTNVDTIKDFKPGQGDVIVLDRDIFRKIGPALEGTEFFAGKGAVKGHDRNDRIVYDTKTGNLYYDDDGSKKGGHDAVLFATLAHKPALDAADFVIV